jgi:hypothetical protein
MQEELRSRGLYAGGSRDELEERLREALEDEEVHITLAGSRVQRWCLQMQQTQHVPPLVAMSAQLLHRSAQ